MIQRGLANSPRARELCAELAGLAVAVDVKGMTRRTAYSDGKTITLSSAPTASAIAPSVVITGGLLSLMSLAGPTPEAVLQRGDVQITGDVEIAQKFRELFFLLCPDLEEELSRVIGDTPAHQLGRFAKAVAGWGRNAARTAALNASEYLAHERADLVSRGEGEAFFRDVDTVREAVDRLEARLAALPRKTPR